MVIFSSSNLSEMGRIIRAFSSEKNPLYQEDGGLPRGSSFRGASSPQLDPEITARDQRLCGRETLRASA